MVRLLFSILIFVFPTYAHAYLGPGMAGGAVVAAIGFFGAIFLALGAILYFPIKRALKKRKEPKKLSQEDT